MSEKKTHSGKRLSREILGLLATSFIISLFLFQLLSICSVVIVDGVLTVRGINLTDEQLRYLDGWVFQLILLLSVGFFIVLFLFLLGERLSYIRDIIRGIDALRSGQMDHRIPIEGNNELTRLAEAVNFLSESQRQFKEKERALNEEKEQLIRTLSHDIRTPLTSIMAYSEFLAGRESCSAAEQAEYFELIQKKTQQIKELTDILLDGGKRNVEYFEDARLLMEQLAGEFEEALEDDFSLKIDLSGCGRFAGSFDVQELRRVFDNLISNVQKYADRMRPVSLSVRTMESLLVICQENVTRSDGEQQESYQMGLNSIRRIAHNYSGQVETQGIGESFIITITLSDF